MAMVNVVGAAVVILEDDQIILHKTEKESEDDTIILGEVIKVSLLEGVEGLSDLGPFGVATVDNR